MSWNRSGHKYNAKKTVVDGITFASMAEAKRYGELKLLEQAGEISELELQPTYLLQEAFCYGGKAVRKIEYTADFQYVEASHTVVEDVKGMPTPDFRIKWKLFLYRFPRLDARLIGLKPRKKRKTKAR